MKCIGFILLAVFYPFFVSAQTPKTAVIDVNNVKVIIKSDGTLFQDEGKGGFMISGNDSISEVSLMQGAGLWISGFDPDLNLRGAIQVHNEDDKRDFIPTPGMNNFWRVTAADINAHILDFEDNGIIDNPIASVFSWPVKSNPFFETYNEPDIILDSDINHFGSYYDRNDDDIYDPSKGDYPVINMPYCLDIYHPKPTEMLWFSFTDKVDHTQSQMAPLNFVIQCEVYVFSCEEENPLNNSVIVNYKLINNGITDIDSTRIGVYVDFSIGNPFNDFIGSSPERGMIYAYNGTESDSLFEDDIPVIGSDVLLGPYAYVNDTMVFLEPLFFQTLGDVSDLSGLQYHNLLSGKNIDGSVPQNGGVAFPDDPNLINGNSEFALGNVPGQRQGLTSFGPFTFPPGAVHTFTMVYSFKQKNDQTSLENLSEMFQQNDEMQSMFYNCSFAENCSSFVTTYDEFETDFEVFPNPTSDFVIIQTDQTNLKEIALININGQVVKEFVTNDEEIRLSINDVPSGMYVIQLETKNGQSIQRKLVVTR